MTADVIEVVLLLIVAGLLLRVLSWQREARRVARETKSDAANAATDAREAARVAKAVLDRLEKEQGVVAVDLAATQERAAAADRDPGPGSAADAAVLLEGHR